MDGRESSGTYGGSELVGYEFGFEFVGSSVELVYPLLFYVCVSMTNIIKNIITWIDYSDCGRISFGGIIVQKRH